MPVYCSVDCKKEWYQVNPIMYEYICDYCGKEFTSLAKIAKFCSHKCFERNRLYRKEDIQMVIKFLEKEEPIPNLSYLV